MNNTHITDVEWSRFWQEQMTPGEQEQLLKHVCACDSCSARMSEGPENADLIHIPAWQAQETLTYVRKHTPLLRFLRSNHFQLFGYSIKVSLAVTAMLFLLFRPETTTVEYNPADRKTDFSVTELLHQGTDIIGQTLNDFSSKILNKKEGYNHEK